MGPDFPDAATHHIYGLLLGKERVDNRANGDLFEGIETGHAQADCLSIPDKGLFQHLREVNREPFDYSEALSSC